MEETFQFWPNLSSNPQRNKPQHFVTYLNETLLHLECYNNSRLCIEGSPRKNFLDQPPLLSVED